MVNAIFDNLSSSELLPIELVVMPYPSANAVPPDYDPDSLGSFTFVYGKGGQYQNEPVEGRARRRIGSTQQGPGTRDYTVFTINW
jgi:hypothetical protein